MQAAQRGAQASGTPFVSFYAPGDILAMAREAGFSDARHVPGPSLGDRYSTGRADGLRPSSGEDLLVAATAALCQTAGGACRYHRTVASSVTPSESDLAPGSLRLVQSLASTAEGEVTDLLGTREQAADWLRAQALIPDDGRLSNSEYAALLRLREAIRDSLTAHCAVAAAADAAARLTRALADGRVVVTVDPASGVGLASAARASYSSVVAAFAVAIAESAPSGAWLRLKSCAAPDCGRAFYDGSDGSGRNHCSGHSA